MCKENDLLRVLQDKQSEDELGLIAMRLPTLDFWFSGKDINSGRSPLGVAAELDFGILTLTALGADTDFRDRFDATALEYACRYRNIQSMELLLGSKSSILCTSEDSKVNLLHILSERGYSRELHLLLTHPEAVPQLNKAINAFDNLGCTPLMRAVEAKSAACVKLLLSHGAHINVSNPDWTAETAMHVAARYPDRVIVRLLLENGASLESRDYLERTPYQLLLQWHDSEVPIDPEVVNLMRYYK